MGDFRGRIIHAYFDGTAIIVKKTKLYHFCPVETARKTFELFLRQMASMPVGDIKARSQHIFRPSTPSSIALDELKLDSDWCPFAVRHTSTVEVSTLRGVSILG